MRFACRPCPASSLSIVVENGPKNPAVPMKIRELRGLQFLVEFVAANFLQEFVVVPEPPDRRAFRVPFERLVALLFRGIALLLRIHFVAIHLVIPPGQPKYVVTMFVPG